MNDREAQRRHVLAEFDKYGILAHRVGAIRRALNGGADLADVLVHETQAILGSDMPREQLASALVSVMAYAACGDYADEQHIQRAAANASAAWLTVGATPPDLDGVE